ncbi:5'-nucleotidase, lipoprotein e(P4) family [Neobacillus drentensis]|uniref:5'-nucleotidase, lipoprotein e(P4) family n=1 Tax=Neobacillus drentensis TaxID=220684 RepID=UPI001F486343|nr:5'-nucleotidase, lipoprotein e(P4) family [Neobacillus drentensis]ULT58031.1 5'-nucleotidase, lipoprotein e(P4) family [Neobacillus drentensis]
MKGKIIWMVLVLLGLFINGITVKAETQGSPSQNLYEQNTMSVLWFQNSAEAKALYYQGYNLGRVRLDELLKNRPKTSVLKPAIVLDIDETILDNSPHQAWFVLYGKGIPFGWNGWFNRGEAKALPGAIEFLQYANARGVAIFYISNRNEAQKEPTMKNLINAGAPQVNSEHVLLQQPGEKGKETRRIQVAKTHDVLLYFGDNLGDFSGFEGLSVSERSQEAAKRQAEFGRKLIVFPNPMYGDWEGAIYQYDYRKTNEEKDKLRKQQLEIYKR